MRSIFNALLAVLPLAYFAAGTASASDNWKQSCSGPAYVCGDASPVNSVTAAPVKKTKPATVAKAKVKKPVDVSSDETPVKAKKAKVAKADDEDTAVKAKPKKAKVASKAKPKAQVAKADDDDEAPVKPKKKAKVAKNDGGGSEYQSGTASWYGGKFNGRKTANGETYDMWEMTAAHKSLPFGTRVKVTNTSNGNSTVVRINDRGPYVGGRVIDLSRAAANDIGMGGLAPVKLTILGKG